MNLMVLAGSANIPLAQTVVDTLLVRLDAAQVHRFPDGELHVELQESGRGCDVYLLQPPSPPVGLHLLELLLLADACRRAGAAYLTAVVPYYGSAKSPMSKRNARVRRSIASSSGVNKSNSRVAKPADWRTLATERLPGLCRLLPLPWAKMTTASAPAGWPDVPQGAHPQRAPSHQYAG
jgi:hypothetical protein